MSRRKPSWWQLYLLIGIAVGLLALAASWHTTEMLHGTANIAIVLTAYGAFNMWLSFNGEALEQAQAAKKEAAHGKSLPISEQQAHYRHLMRIHQLLKTGRKSDN